MTSVLAAFGLGDDGEQLYRRVLRTVGQDGDRHRTGLGWTTERFEAASAALVAVRMLRVDPDGNLAADHPRTSISRLVDRESARLDLRRRELDDVRAAVSEFAADHRAGRGGEIAPTSIEVLPAVVRAVHLDVASGPVTDPGVLRLTRSQMAQGREVRSIYPVAILDDPGLLDFVADWAAAGEQQRVVEKVAHEFVVFGDEAVIAPPHWGSTEGGTVVIRLPLLVQAFGRLFEDAWASGLPVPQSSDSADVGTRLLTLLAAGFKDEAIARYLGVGVRTVRRRVAESMDELGVRTRFQLGVAAERRSLLGRPRR